MMRFRSTIFGGLLLAGIGCNQPTTAPAPSTPPGSGAALTPVEIQLNWFPEAEHGGYYAALVHGYFRDAGLEVTVTPGKPGFPLMENVDSGRAGFGVDNADKLLRARVAGADVVAVFAPIQDSPRCIMVHEESGVTRLEDLATTPGLTIAWNDSQPFAKFLKQKLDLTEAKMIGFPGNVGPFLLDKKFAQQAYNISEPYLAREKEPGTKPVSLLLSDLGFNTYTSLLLTNRKMLAENPELVRKVVHASQRGWIKYLSDAAETNRHISQLNSEMPEGVLEFGVRELQALCRPGDLAESQIGGMSRERWKTLARQLEEIEPYAPGAIQETDAYSLEFLPTTVEK